jgi:hypothetical protein
VAHTNLHLALGVGVGTAVAVIPVARAWLAGRPLARPIAVMLIASYGLGLWAIAPNLAAKAGVHLAGARWADVFVLHTTLDRRIDGGLLLGELALCAALVSHYGLIIAALIRARRGRTRAPS